MIHLDILQYIVDLLPISDKRSFIGICKKTYQLSCHMPRIEIDFQKMINDTHFISDSYFYLCYPLHKYTVELLFDGYSIPNKYINEENIILQHFSRIYKTLGKRNNLSLIKKMLKLNVVEENAQHVMMGAAKKGNIKILKWMIRNYYGHNDWMKLHRCYHSRQIIGYAGKGNQLITLRWLNRNGFVDVDFAGYLAASKGYTNIVSYLITNKSTTDSSKMLEVIKTCKSSDLLGNLCAGAIKFGDLDVLKFAFKKGIHVDECFYVSNLSMLTWLYDNNHIQSKLNITIAAAKTNLECLRFLYSHKFPVLNCKIFAAAASLGNISAIKWLHEIGCPFDYTATSAAVTREKDALIVLKLFVKWGCNVEADICEIAVCYGNLEVLQYLCGLGYSLSNQILLRATDSGYLHIIIWCREQGCEWNESVCAQAEQVHILKWLRGFNRNKFEIKSDETEICPWDEKVCLSAIINGNINILKFALENGCPFGTRSHASIAKSKNKVIKNYVKDFLVKQ
jgi:hypothetical protein